MENIDVDDIKRTVKIFTIADKKVIYPLFLYQGEAFMDALFTDAHHPLQHAVMAIAWTNSFKSNFFKVIFDPYTPNTEKLITVRSSKASLKVAHEFALDDVLIIDDFNTEGSHDDTQAKKDKIWDLIRAYADKTPAKTWNGPHKVLSYALRGGCVFTAEEELTGEIESEGARYIKVFFGEKTDKNVLTYFQNNPQILSLFWADFIGYLEEHYVDLVGQLRQKFTDLRIKYEGFHFPGFCDTCIHVMLTAKTIADYVVD